MAEDHRRCCGEDRISDLPDELLHDIVLRLGSSHAAARTSVLSHRWRRVWAHLPELRLGTHRDPPLLPASLLDAIDGALAGYSDTAPLDCLHITLFAAAAATTTDAPNVTPSRAAPWLRFAAQHVVGELILHVPYQSSLLLASPDANGKEAEEEELELAVCTRAKTIKLKLRESWRLRPQPAGSFTALIALTIRDCRMEASELMAMVSKHCPCLRDLFLFIDLVQVSDVSLLSDTLQSLTFAVANTRQLEVIAPSLEKLRVDDATKARICCPMLAEVVWNGVAYDPRHHKFENVGRHLCKLDVGRDSVVAPFMQQFDEVDDLRLLISAPWEITHYESFFSGTYQLPRCKTLRIFVEWGRHACLVPYTLHLLRSCNGTRKVYVSFLYNSDFPLACPSSCPCRLAERRRIDEIALNSIEEVDISISPSLKEEFKFLEQLSRCNAPVLKKLVINYGIFFPAIPAKEVCEKVRSMWRPNVRVEFYMFLERKRVRFN